MSDHVTALMLTTADRIGFVVRAAINFKQQEYVNKSLYVLADSDATWNKLTAAIPPLCLHETLGGVVADKPGNMTESLDLIKKGGGYLAIWDDDNICHPLRLTRQVEAAREHGAPSFLSSGMWHFHDSSELFIYELDKRHDLLKLRVVFPSMVCDVKDIPAGNFISTTGLATAVLGKRTDIAMAVGEWWWMKVGVHAMNRSGYQHHRRFALDPVRGMSARWLRERQSWIIKRMRKFNWDTDTISVCGNDGEAFSVNGLTRWADGANGLPDLPAAAEIVINEELPEGPHVAEN